MELQSVNNFFKKTFNLCLHNDKLPDQFKLWNRFWSNLNTLIFLTDKKTHLISNQYVGIISLKTFYKDFIVFKWGMLVKFTAGVFVYYKTIVCMLKYYTTCTDYLYFKIKWVVICTYKKDLDKLLLLVTKKAPPKKSNVWIIFM